MKAPAKLPKILDSYHRWVIAKESEGNIVYLEQFDLGEQFFTKQVSNAFLFHSEEVAGNRIPKDCFVLKLHFSVTRAE